MPIGQSPHSSAELLVGHVAVALTIAPQPGDFLRVDDAEYTLVPVFPPDQARVTLVVVQQVSDKFPQMLALEAWLIT